MFLIDKYEPKAESDLYFHKDVYENLKIMAKDDSIPHIIFYGPEGAGKRTMVRFFLELIYDNTVNWTEDVTYTINGSGNTTVDVQVKQSNYHIEIMPFNTNFDRYLIQDIVKGYAERMPINLFMTDKTFKTVVINNLDNLLYYAQTSLRRTLEKYAHTCRFIMWCNSLSKVIKPLRSRCICMKISAPSNCDMFSRIHDISTNEGMRLSLEQYKRIVYKADGNIKQAIWNLDMLRHSKEIMTSYDKAILKIALYILSGDLENIQKIRVILCRIIRTNITGSKTIHDLTLLLCNFDAIDFKMKAHIIELASQFEYNLIKGRHEIIHIESFIHCILTTICMAHNT